MPTVDRTINAFSAASVQGAIRLSQEPAKLGMGWERVLFFFLFSNRLERVAAA
jgi:hypothetical protein